MICDILTIYIYTYIYGIFHKNHHEIPEVDLLRSRLPPFQAPRHGALRRAARRLGRFGVLGEVAKRRDFMEFTGKYMVISMKFHKFP